MVAIGLLSSPLGLAHLRFVSKSEMHRWVETFYNFFLLFKALVCKFKKATQGMVGHFSKRRGFSVKSSLQSFSSNSFLWKRLIHEKAYTQCSWQSNQLLLTIKSTMTINRNILLVGALDIVANKLITQSRRCCLWANTKSHHPWLSKSISSESRFPKSKSMGPDPGSEFSTNGSVPMDFFSKYHPAIFPLRAP